MTDPLVILFGGKTKARILTELLSHPEQSYHLRGLAKAAETDSGNTSKLLKPLVDAGIVLAAPDVHSTRYMINTRSPLVPALRQLVANASSLLADLRAVAHGLDAAYIGVYGSVAAGTDDTLSDVDVLVVGELSSVVAQTAFKAAGRKHRKTVNVLAVTPADFARNITDGAALWKSISDGARIDLKGTWDDAAQRPTTAN
jgi:predicted nucleotidyltransferase